MFKKITENIVHFHDQSTIYTNKYKVKLDDIIMERFTKPRHIFKENVNNYLFILVYLSKNFRIQIIKDYDQKWPQNTQKCNKSKIWNYQIT